MREGSLCTGYNGLGLAVESVLETELAWVSEVDPAACSVLDARYPGVPNIGDLTVMDWTQVEPVDVLTAGYPESSLTLPASGMTLAGVLYERPMSERATAEPDSSCLPTPRATRGGSATETVGLLPTPNTMDGMTPRTADALARAKQRGGCSNLKDVLLPTPTTSDANGTGGHGEGGMDLRTHVACLLPTPTARDFKDGAGTTWHPEKSKLPHSIGALTEPPSPPMPAVLADSLHLLWTDQDD